MNTEQSIDYKQHILVSIHGGVMGQGRVNTWVAEMRPQGEWTENGRQIRLDV